MDMQTSADAQGFPAITYNPTPQNPNMIHPPSQQTPSKTYKYQSSSPQHQLAVDENQIIESQGIERTFSETMPTPTASVAGSIARSVAKSMKTSQTARSNESEGWRQQAQHNHYQQHQQQQHQHRHQQHSAQKVISHKECTEKQQRAKKVFWVCFCSQLVVIFILVVVWTSSPASLVEKSVLGATEGKASSGTAQMLIGINDTFRINTWDEFLGLSDDDYFGDGTLCPQGIDTPIAVLTDKPCYARPDGSDGAYSEPIAVIFENCAPQPDDWIGIYDADHNIFQPGIHRVDYWSWACGDQECQTPVRGGIIVFAGIQAYGDFKVHLHRREGEAEEMYLASSETFTVQQVCL